MLTEAESAELDELACIDHKALKSKGMRRHGANKPCMRVPGPLIQVILDPKCVSEHHPLGWGHSWK